MRSFAVAAGLALVVVGLGTACTRDAARAFVAAGRGGVGDTSAVRVTAVATAAEATDYDGNPVRAGTESKYVLVDCLITAPPNQVDITDFQLIQERVAEVGTETNLGNNDDRDYFYWTYLDEARRRLATPPTLTGPFAVRLAFKVPVGSRSGYLFYWGLYWGPFDFPSAGAAQAVPGLRHGVGFGTMGPPRGTS
jgi:hypothetical protein